MLNHSEAKKLFSNYGIRLEGTEFSSVEEAAKQFGRGEYYLKLISTDQEASHKTEFGYVRRVTSRSSLRAAWKDMAEKAKVEGHESSTFILQSAASGYEVMVGAKRDHTFGFQIVFTPEGGKYTEIHAKVAPPVIRVGNLSHEEALVMIKEHPFSPKIMGARGEQPVDVEALAGLLVRLSRLMKENPDVAAVDLNPVFARPDGINIVDARVEMREPENQQRTFYVERNLTPFKRPKCAAVVLASARPSSVGMVLLENVMRSVGNVRVMLPGGKGAEHLEELGIPIYDEIPNGCDLLVYAGMPADAPRTIAEFRNKGGKAAVIISSDFSETGHVALEEELRKNAGDIPYLGPNCLGVYASALNTFFIDEVRTAYPQTDGTIALFSQSGGLCIESFCEYLNTYKVPVNEVFSVGNGSGISFTEMLNSVADNPLVDWVVVYMEGGLKDGEGPFFIEALRKATRVKPVLILPAGLSRKGRRSAASHTGRMTSSADALKAALRQGGAILAKSEEQLRLAIRMLHTMPCVSGKAVIFTIGGGKGILSTDAAEREGLELRQTMPEDFVEKIKPSMPHFADCTRNPLDFTGAVTLDGMLTVLEHAKSLDSPGVLHVYISVPGATVYRQNGRPVQLDEFKAVDALAEAIKSHDLPFVLNICAQTPLSRAVEERAEQSGIVVTRTTPVDMVMGALKLTMEVWRRYPKADLRSKRQDINLPVRTDSRLGPTAARS